MNENTIENRENDSRATSTLSTKGLAALHLTPGLEITSETTGNTYIVGEYLGEGAFGTVFHCTDTWENDLAIKVLKPLQDLDRQPRDLAEREMRALVHVRHPYVVPIHDAFVLDTQCCLVSERCSQTLEQFVELPDFDPFLWLRGLARCLLQAVHFTHIQQLAHCDIHEGNVFVHFIRDEIVPENHSAMVFKLGDFGLARPFSEITAETTFLNTICPPEIILPEEFGPINHKVDVYQAGLLLLRFMLQDCPQFTQQDLLDGYPQKLALAQNDPLFDALARMLRRHSEYRTPTAMDAWNDIKNALICQ